MSEHRTIAPEMSFIADERDTMRVEEGMIVSGIRSVLGSCGTELELLKVSLEEPKTPFPELAFPEIYAMLERLGHKLPEDQDLDRESEKLLTEYVKKEFGSDFFFVNRFPSKVKPFYVMHVDENPRYARSVDMLYKGLELSSGGQREHRHDRIVYADQGEGDGRGGPEVVHGALQVRRPSPRWVLAGHREVHRPDAQHREREGGRSLPEGPRKAATLGTLVPFAVIFRAARSLRARTRP